MSYLTNLQRKIIYAVGILLLFIAIYPYKRYLQAEADKKDLGEATIGEVDTGSFVLKLFLLGGFRGMAANVLWTRAIDFQKVQEWDKLKVTVDMITKLQPHFLSIWTFQSWNLTYNVSVEWDAPEDKYEWIKRGIKFVQDGVKKNQKSPDLIWDTAWYYYHKLGFSDESIILRRLFRDDDDESFKKSPIDRRRHLPRQLPARPRLVRQGRQARRRGRGPPGRRQLRDRRARRRPGPAQGPAGRPPVPLDARPRPDPLRHRPGEGEHEGDRGHLRPKAQDAVAEGPTRSGTTSATTLRDLQPGVEVDGKLTHQMVKLDDNTSRSSTCGSRSTPQRPAVQAVRSTPTRSTGPTAGPTR